MPGGVHGVVGRLGGDRHGPRQVDARRHERGQHAAHALDDGGLEKASRHRELQEGPSRARPALAVERRSATKPTTTSRMIAAMAHHQVLMKPETLSSIRVGSGSFAFSEAKNVRNFGQHERGQDDDRDDGHDRHHGRVDQRRGHRRPGLNVGLEVLGQFQEDRVERSGQLGRLEDGDVVAGERLGVGRRGGGEGVARLELARPCRGGPSSGACRSSPRRSPPGPP